MTVIERIVQSKRWTMNMTTRHDDRAYIAFPYMIDLRYQLRCDPIDYHPANELGREINRISVCSGRTERYNFHEQIHIVLRKSNKRHHNLVSLAPRVVLGKRTVRIELRPWLCDPDL